jgi:hypothetical protein
MHLNATQIHPIYCFQHKVISKYSLRFSNYRSFQFFKIYSFSIHLDIHLDIQITMIPDQSRNRAMLFAYAEIVLPVNLLRSRANSCVGEDRGLDSGYLYAASDSSLTSITFSTCEAGHSVRRSEIRT